MAEPHRTPEEKPEEKKHWLERRATINGIIGMLAAACIALFAGDLMYHKHPHFEIDKTFGFYGIWGFVCFFLLVLAGKQFRKIVMRNEDYYDRH